MVPRSKFPGLPEKVPLEKFSFPWQGAAVGQGGGVSEQKY
jgi:hypothetical protein